MNWRKDIWTLLLVTVVTVLIWMWAAGETRERKTLNATLRYTVPDPSNWIIKPEQQAVGIVIEGSRLALQKAQGILRLPLTVTIPAATGRQTLDLQELVRRHDELRSTGVSVLSVDPSTAEVELDQIERVTVAVKPNLPGVIPQGEVVVDPPEAIISLPSQQRARIGQSFSVEAVVDRAELERLQPGVQQTLDAKLRLPETFGSANDVTITPSRVKLKFTVRSRTRETRLDTVRVHIAGPPEDDDLYSVSVDPKQLRDVTISTDADLIRRIVANEVPVVAVLHISSREKEMHIDAKKISYFVALVPDSGGIKGVLVNGKINDSTDLPLIKLTITERTKQ